MTSRKTRVSLVTAIIVGSWLGLCGLTGCKHVEVTAADPGPVEAKDWVRVWYHMRYSPLWGESIYARRRCAGEPSEGGGMSSDEAPPDGIDYDGTIAPFPKDETEYEDFTERVQFGSYSVLSGPTGALLFHEGVPVWAGEHVLPLRTKGRVYALCLLTSMPQESMTVAGLYDCLWVMLDVPAYSGIGPMIENQVPAYMHMQRPEDWVADIDGDGTDELVAIEPRGEDLSWTQFSCLTKVRWMLCLYGKQEAGSVPPPNALLEVPLPAGITGWHLILKRQTEPQRGLVVWDGSVPDVSVESPRRLGTIMRAPKTEKWRFVEHTKDAAP